jgi:ADP-ribose pyrophosphatase YjhB (NUDIX family)
VEGEEALSVAATREVREESGLIVEAGRLAYIEELIEPDQRLCKFWFVGRLLGGELSTTAPEAKAEHIVEAAWLTQQDLDGKTVFPSVILAEYWTHRDEGFKSPQHLGLRRMNFW